MGRIYFNPKTGDFWESSKYNRVPPSEEYEYTGLYVDYRYTKKCITRAVFCPKCNIYHFKGHVGRTTLPLYEEYELEWIKKFGCEIAKMLSSSSSNIFLSRWDEYKLLTQAAEKIGTEKIKKILDELVSVVRSLSPKEKRKVAKGVLKAIIEGDETLVYARMISGVIKK